MAMLNGSQSPLARVYVSIAAEIIRRGERRRRLSAKRVIANAADFFSLLIGTNALSLYLLLGGSLDGVSRPRLAILVACFYVVLHATNRYLIRLWVLDEKGGVRSNLIREPWIKHAVTVCFLGTLVLLALGSIKYALH